MRSRDKLESFVITTTSKLTQRSENVMDYLYIAVIDDVIDDDGKRMLCWMMVKNEITFIKDDLFIHIPSFHVSYPHSCS